MTENETGEHDLQFKEWQSNKELLDMLGNRIYVLRKYGFSFITTLLTAQAILIPGNLFGAVSLPDIVKFAVFSVTILLILALLLFEKSYQILHEAAEQRAIVLERILNLDLLETLSVRFQREHVDWYKTIIYGLFIIATLLLAWSALFQINSSPSLYNLYYLLILTISSSFGFYYIINLSPGSKRPGDLDSWNIDKLEVKENNKVKITYTYFGKNKSSFKQLIKAEISRLSFSQLIKEKLKMNNKKEKSKSDKKEKQKNKNINIDSCYENQIFEKDDLLWEITTLDGSCVHREFADYEITIPCDHNYTWLWEPKNNINCIKEEVFELVPLGIEKYILKRKIIIQKDSTDGLKPCKETELPYPPDERDFIPERNRYKRIEK